MRVLEYIDFTPLRVALAALVLAAAFALWALAGAFRDGPASELPRAGGNRVAPLRQVALAPPADVDAAVEQDIFAPDRSAPSEPFHMPGEASASTAAAVASPKPTVLGTAVSDGASSFATARFGDAAPRIVRVGDKLGPYTVVAIARGRVTFRTADGDRLDVAALAASTQETANASPDTTTMPSYNRGAYPGAGRAFYGFGAGRRGRRGATPDTTSNR